MNVENQTQKNLDKNKRVTPPEQIERDKVKDIVQSLIKAYSALKFYPIENPAVINSTMVFSDKLMDFLSEYEEIRIGIHEFSLSFNKEILHTDGEKKKSFPFLLFKDGMRELSFHEGLDLEEIGDFLESVKENADLPEEENNIINSLWEKDFAHIRYFALDEFLDENIGGSNLGEDLVPGKDELSTGKIKLTKEDKENINKQLEILAVDPGNDLAEGITTPLSKVNKISEAAAITKNDSPEIEKLVADDRESSRIRELIILLFEVLFLEDREAQFSETLNVLDVCLQESLEKGNFSQASHILNEISDLKDVVPEQDSDKLLFLDKIINKLKDAAAIQELEQQFFNEKIKNLDSFLEYFQLLCPESIPSIIHLWEKTKDLNVHNRITLLLQKISEKHIETLVEFAKNSHASLVMEIISILGKINTAQTLPFLKTFSANKDMSIRLETIQAIKNIRDKQGDEILLDMLLDKEEQIRIAAVTSLNPSENPAAVNRIIELIAKKDFDKKNRSEKRVLLNYCAQNNSKEVIFLFHSLLKKRTLFLSKKTMATRLCIISTLGAMATPEAVTILKEVSLLRKTRIRKACKFALRKLAARYSQYREITVI